MATSWGQLKTPRRAQMATEQSDLRRLSLACCWRTSPFLRQPNEAISSWEQSLSLNPDQPLTTNNIMFFRTSLVSMSERFLWPAAAAASPLNPQILDTLGTVHLALGDAEAAVPVLAIRARHHSGTPHGYQHDLAAQTKPGSRFRQPSRDDMAMILRLWSGKLSRI